MNLIKRLFQHGVDRFKRGKGCEAQRSKAVWQHQSDAKQGALRDLTFRTEANMQAIYMLMDSPSWRPNWWPVPNLPAGVRVFAMPQARSLGGIVLRRVCHNVLLANYNKEESNDEDRNLAGDRRRHAVLAVRGSADGTRSHADPDRMRHGREADDRRRALLRYVRLQQGSGADLHVQLLPDQARRRVHGLGHRFRAGLEPKCT